MSSNHPADLDTANRSLIGYQQHIVRPKSWSQPGRPYWWSPCGWWWAAVNPCSPINTFQHFPLSGRTRNVQPPKRKGRRKLWIHIVDQDPSVGRSRQSDPCTALIHRWSNVSDIDIHRHILINHLVSLCKICLQTGVISENKNKSLLSSHVSSLHLIPTDKEPFSACTRRSALIHYKKKVFLVTVSNLNMLSRWSK